MKRDERRLDGKSKEQKGRSGEGGIKKERRKEERRKHSGR